MRFFALLLFTFLVLLSGCSTTDSHREKTEENLQKQTAEQVFQTVSERLDELAKTAKEVGPAAENYLATDLFLKAAAASAQGDSHTAVLLYRHMLKIHPQDIYIQKKLGIELIRISELPEAEKLLTHHYKKAPSTEVGLILAGLYVTKEQDKKAFATFDKVLKRDPKNVEACLFYVKALGAKQLYKKAHSLLDQCAKRTKSEGLFSFYHGRLYLEEKRLKKAEVSFSKALKENSQLYQAALGLGLLAEDQDDFKKASTIYERYLKNDPDNSVVLNRLVQILFSLGEFTKVLPYAETLTHLDPEDLNLKIKLGILYSDAKLYGQSIETFEDILKQVPDSDKVLYYLGSIYQELKNDQEAIRYFNRIPVSSGLYLDSSLQVAHILKDQVKSRGLEETHFLAYINERSETNSKIKVELQVLKASWLEEKKLVDEAISTLEEIRSLQEFNEGHQYYLASLYERVQKYGESDQLVLAILETNPENAHAMNFLGYSLLERGEDLKRAYQLISKAVELKPKDGYIRDSMGWYYYRTGDYKKALHHLNQAYTYVSEDQVIIRHLGMVYQKLNKYHKAKKYFKLALEKSGEEQEREEMRQEIQKVDHLLRLPASE